MFLFKSRQPITTEKREQQRLISKKVAQGHVAPLGDGPDHIEAALKLYGKHHVVQVGPGETGLCKTCWLVFFYLTQC